MSSPSVMKPLPTMDTLQEEHTKQSLCQWRPSKAMKRVPPMPVRRTFATTTVRSCSSMVRGFIEGILTCDGLAAGRASFGEEFSKAIGAEGLVLSRGEALSGQGFLTVGAGEAFSMPGLVSIRHPTLSYDLKKGQ